MKNRLLAQRQHEDAVDANVMGSSPGSAGVAVTV
jgi:hypothetical protein